MVPLGDLGGGHSFTITYGLFQLDIFLCIVSFYNSPQARVTEVGLF